MSRARKSLFRDNYQEVRAEAQAKANASGFDYGILRDMFGFSARMLPRVENRYGYERTCEVVHCEALARCKPGHGPLAKVTP